MLEYRNVSLSSGGVRILDDINVAFKAGKLTTIIGPNGCGKTTLIQALNGQSRLCGGGILLDNEDFSSFKPKQRARKVSFLPQVHMTIPAVSTHTLVSHGRFPYLGFARKMGEEDKRIIREAMKTADILEYENEGVDTLSGGVRQRAFIAMQLAQGCEYIVADEPTTYLDVKSRKQVLDIYSKLRNEGKTVVLVLHDIAKALEISDELIIMKNRKILFSGTPEEALKAGIVEEVFETEVKTFTEDNRIYYVTD